MKFFIDTANIDEIKKGIEMGLVDGVTTNPSLLSKEKRDPQAIIKEILSIVEGPVSLEVVSTNSKEMIEESRKLASLGQNAVIKIPMTEEGVKAVKTLSGEGIKTNVTLIFQPIQALIAAKAGASYVSPFIGRLDDISQRGMGIIEDIATIFTNYGFEAEIIVASIRNPIHVLDAALIGADIATIPFNVLSQLIRHPLTDIGLEKFLKDWQSIKQ
ncbi:MAG TPA: fructose-6-phosphate aldolase [Syntrophorhabdaceae bacterium]|jgi:transaldolase|nr:fructose-6-phosphate aldolase [Syntrophorhabdaceae bacterium]MDI9559898.1 fructose-6-phosphate aldolase [Pseudomonadota bacterium]OQC51466.1 MAG: Transaldolase [Deltaproteobacteria bacterium ADurb.Bin026]MBP8698739.1 fructose-6-phosphate aldolase [Syntrophorhabdaceae bacterium]MBV6504555.1 Transaldolase [Syntrophorhabdaceae bacterium]